MFRGVAERDSRDLRPRWFGRERRVERPFGMRVEVGAHQRHRLATRGACVQQVGHFHRPVDLGATRAGGRLTKVRQRFGEQNNARRAVAFVFVIDMLRTRFRRGERPPLSTGLEHASLSPMSPSTA